MKMEEKGFNEVKRYVLSSPIGASSPSKPTRLGAMSLDDLRDDLFGDNAMLELVKEKREKEKVEELRQMKIRHQQMRARKHKESMEIQKVMVELEKRKQQELELRLQKERVKQGLERIDKSHLGKLESEKRRELEKVSKERQALQDREEAILLQVQDLETKILEQEEIANKRKQEIEAALAKRGGSKLDQKNAQLLQLAKAHGERTASLQAERERLEQERKELEDNLTRLGDRETSTKSHGNGDGGAASPLEPTNEDMRDIIDNVEQRIAEQQERLTRLRLEHEEETKTMRTNRILDESVTKTLRPPGINKSLPFTIQAESFLNEWLQKDPKHAGPLNHAYSALDDQYAEQVRDEDQVQQPQQQQQQLSSEQNQVKRDTEDVETTKSHTASRTTLSTTSPTSTRSRRQSPQHRKSKREKPFQKELERMKAEYNAMDYKDPEIWEQIQRLESQIHGVRKVNNVEHSPRHHNHSYYPMPPMSQPSPQPQQQPPMSPLLDYHLAKQEMQLDKQERMIRKLAKKGTRADIRKKSKKNFRRKETSSDSETNDTDDDSYHSSSSTASSPSASPRYRRHGKHHKKSKRKFRNHRVSYEKPRFQNSMPRRNVSNNNSNQQRFHEEQRHLEEQRRLFDRTMDGLAKKLRFLGGGGGGAGLLGAGVFPSGVANNGPDGLANTVAQSDNSSTGISKNQFLEELSTLEMIPKDSELYDIQVEHLKMMTKMRLEIDELKQEQMVANVKEELERKQRELKKRAEFEELKLEQERQLELAKLKRALAKEKADFNWNGRECASKRPYDPDSGFVIYFDYVMNIPKRFNVVRLVFCIYDGQDVKTNAKALPPCETEMETPSKHNALFISRKKFQKVPPLTSLRVVVELQYVGTNNQGEKAYQSIGWTVFDLFQELSVPETHINLRDGAIKLPLNKPPFKIDQLEQTLKGENPPDEKNSMILFLRVIHAEDMDASAEFVVDPHVTQHLYQNPFLKKKEKKEATKKSSKKSKKSKKESPSKQKHEDDAGSDVASVAESVGSSVSKAQSTLNRKLDPKLRQGYGVELEKVSFDDESPAQPIYVRVTMIPCAKQYRLHGDDAKMLLSMKSSNDEGMFDFGMLGEGELHVWQSPPRDILLSTGQADWKGAASTNTTFFDGVQLEPTGILLFKVFKRLHSLENDNPETNDEDFSEDDELLGWGIKYFISPNHEFEQDLRKPFDVELIQPQVALPFNPAKAEWVNARITVRLKKAAKTGRRKSRSSHRHGSGVSVGSRSRISSIQEEDDEDLMDSTEEEDMEDMEDEDDLQPTDENSKPFVEIAHPPKDSKSSLFIRGDDGYDIYVDGARYLPDYVTISCVKVKVLAQNFSLLSKEEIGFPKLSDSAFSPSYRLRMECRGDEIANPASTILFRVDCVDRFSQKTFAVGYTCLNAFVSADGTGEQPTKPTQQEYMLNDGAFQIPLFQEQPKLGVEFNAKHFQEYGIRRVPCATILVRIVPAKKTPDGVHFMKLEDYSEQEWVKRGLVVPPPKYGPARNGRKGGKRERFETYDSTRCIPSGSENKLYENLLDREDVLIGEVAVLAKRLDVIEDKEVDIMEDEDLLEWIKKRLESPQGVMSMTHIAQYHVETGFKVGIDRLVHVKETGNFFKVIFSLIPPGSYYGDPKLTDNVAFTIAYNWESPPGYPEFNDAPYSFKDIPFDPKLMLIVDVRMLKKKGKETFETKQHSWGFLPIFRDGAFIRNGIHQLPLLEGTVNMDFLRDVQNSEKDPIEYLEQEWAKSSKANRAKLQKSHVSLFVKLIDNQLEDCIPLAMDNLEKSMLPKDKNKRAKYTSYDPEKVAKTKKQLAAMVPKGSTEFDFEKLINEQFASQTDITNYAFR